MIKNSPNKYRYLYAFILSLLLIASSLFIYFDFVAAKGQGPVPAASATIAQEQATATPIPLVTSTPAASASMTQAASPAASVAPTPPTPAATATAAPTPTNPASTPSQAASIVSEYNDGRVQIKVTKVTQKNLAYFVADVRLSSVEYFKTAFAKDTYGLNIHETTSSMARRKNAILAINGDYSGYSKNKLTIRNGVLYNDNFNGEVLVLMKSGEMRIAPDNVSGADLVKQGALQSWSFGPTLVIDGKYVQRSASSHVSAANPRTGIGMVSPLHYIFIVVDGRKSGYSLGLGLKDFANLFIKYGCKVAYNLDGGGSSEMVMNNKILNVPSEGGERATSDIIYIGE